MKTVEEHIARLQRYRNAIRAEAPRLALTQAITCISLVRNRSIEEGIFVNGEKGNTTDYSNNLIPTFFFLGKERNKAGVDYIKKHRSGNWKGFRDAQGLPTDKVNLAYTNRMWSALGPVNQMEYKPNVFRIVTGISDREAADTYKYNRKRYGNFDRPTEEETAQARLDTVAEINAIIRSTQ